MSDYRLSMTGAEVEERLKQNTIPNPYQLKFTGAVDESYDGSEEKTIEIPKPKVKTVNSKQPDENGNIKIDSLPNPHKIIFEGTVEAEYDGSGAVTVTIPTAQGSQTERVEKADSDVTLEPNKLYIFPEMAALAITLAEIANTAVVNEYHFVFQSGATATTLTIPDAVNVPDGFAVEANKIYEISIMENCMAYQSWAV